MDLFVVGVVQQRTPDSICSEECVILARDTVVFLTLSNLLCCGADWAYCLPWLRFY